MDETIKHVEINERKYVLCKMSAFDVVHFNLRFAEILKKHGINQVESIMSMSTKVFGMINREDHDEMLFNLLTMSQVQLADSGENLDSWEAINTQFTADNVTDIYLVALECIRFSILPAMSALKKNIGLDTTIKIQGALQKLLEGLLNTLTSQSKPS